MMKRRKRLIALGDDGNLTLRLSDGRERPIPERPPVRAKSLVLLDCSGSMAGGGKLEDAKAGVVDFVLQAAPKHYSVGVVTFDSAARLIQDLTHDVDVISGALAPVTARGGTDLTEALEIAAEHLGALDGRRVVVVATDGYPNNRATALEAARRVARAGIEIITIGTEDADHDFLRAIATTEDFALSIETRQLAEGIAEAARLLPSSTRGGS